MIKTEKIYKSYGAENVLSGVSFSIEAGQKIALVGYNGTGKTTLLKILAGRETPDSGTLKIRRGIRIAYLPQDISIAGHETVIEYLKKSSGVGDLEKKIAGGRETASIAEKEYSIRNGRTFVHRAETMLVGFGLSANDLDRYLDELSSGEKSKVALVGVILADPNLILLDEPTNNLDFPALILLEEFLKRSKAAVMIVSHDRRFLDRVAQKIFEIDWKTRTLSITRGNYTSYLAQRAKQHERQEEEHRAQQEEIARLKDCARKIKVDAEKGARWVGTDHDTSLWGFKRDRSARSSKKAKAIETRIEQMNIIDSPAKRKPFLLILDPEKNRGGQDILIKDLIAGYPSGFLVGPFSIDIKAGTRVMILGLNGSGKSTILKTIAGVLQPISGSVITGSGVTFGDMTQEHEALPRNEELLTYIKRRAGVDEEHAYGVLGKFGFSVAQGRMPIDALSPGGRARLLFGLFSIFSVNTLLLDEPTNHLDLEAVESLEEMLGDYGGTVVAVSHDRAFIEKIAPDVFLFIESGTVRRIDDYSAYLDAIEQNTKRAIRSL